MSSCRGRWRSGQPTEGAPGADKGSRGRVDCCSAPTRVGSSQEGQVVSSSVFHPSTTTQYHLAADRRRRNKRSGSILRKSSPRTAGGLSTTTIVPSFSSLARPYEHYGSVSVSEAPTEERQQQQRQRQQRRWSPTRVSHIAAASHRPLLSAQPTTGPPLHLRRRRPARSYVLPWAGLDRPRQLSEPADCRWAACATFGHAAHQPRSTLAVAQAPSSALLLSSERCRPLFATVSHQ